MSFFDGANPIGGCSDESVQSNDPIVTLVCQSSFPAGTFSLSAAYSPRPGALVKGSASSPITLHVGRDLTATSLAVTKRVVRKAHPPYTATIVLPSSNSGPIVPTGSVEFLDRGRAIQRCVDRPLTKLSATCVVSYNSTGKHQISARYSGDSNFDSSTSSSRSVQ